MESISKHGLAIFLHLLNKIEKTRDQHIIVRKVDMEILRDPDVQSSHNTQHVNQNHTIPTIISTEV